MMTMEKTGQLVKCQVGMCYSSQWWRCWWLSVCRGVCCDAGLVCVGAASVVWYRLPDTCCLSPQSARHSRAVKRSPARNRQSYWSVAGKQMSNWQKVNILAIW